MDKKEPVSADEHETVKYAGLTWDFLPNHSGYFNYSQNFEPYTLDMKDINGKTLNPKISTNLEVGIKSSFYDKRLNTSIALFRIDQKNRAIDHPDWRKLYQERGYYVYIPVGQVRSEGVELEAAGQIGENGQISLGYTYNKSRYLNDEGSIKAGVDFSKYTPRHLLKLYASYRLPVDQHKWTVGAGVRYQSATEGTFTAPQNRPISGYSVWDAHIAYQATPQLSLQLVGKNLGDKRYFRTVSNRTINMDNYYGEPRNITLQLRWQM